MFQAAGSGSLPMNPWALSNTRSLKRRQSIRNFTRISTGARTVARAGVKAGLATLPLALVPVTAEAIVRTAQVEAGRVSRARARIKAAARARMLHRPKRRATTSLRMETKGACAGHPFECV